MGSETSLMNTTFKDIKVHHDRLQKQNTVPYLRRVITREVFRVSTQTVHHLLRKTKVKMANALVEVVQHLSPVSPLPGGSDRTGRKGDGA